jgi:hypothetical protein
MGFNLNISCFFYYFFSVASPRSPPAVSPRSSGPSARTGSGLVSPRSPRGLSEGIKRSKSGTLEGMKKSPQIERNRISPKSSSLIEDSSSPRTTDIPRASDSQVKQAYLDFVDEDDKEILEYFNLDLDSK